MHPMLLSAVLGVVWGGVAYIVTLMAYKTGASAALSGPLIGLLVYSASRWVYRSRSQLLLIAWSIFSLFAAAAIYGAILGAVIYSERPPSSLGLWDHIRNTAVGCAVGIVILFPLWILLPLAYASHFAVKCVTNERNPKAQVPAGNDPASNSLPS